MYLLRLIKFALVILSLTASFAHAETTKINIAVLRIEYPKILPISRFENKSDDLGFAGGSLANEDNNTTGSFLGFEFALVDKTASPEEASDVLGKLIAGGYQYFILMANEDDLLKLADLVDAGTNGTGLVFNAHSHATELRDNKCRKNILHTAPSNAMLADAVAQYSAWKKWTRWFLISGSNPDDIALADAYRNAAKKFRLDIVEERVYEDTGGSRRTDSGHVLVQRQIPVFTQNANEHDVIVAADASDVFGLYLPYHAWDPRPVFGSGGMRPVSFHAAHEAWGATQFQRRFEKLTGRYVQEDDYHVWLAGRMIGEAVIRVQSGEPAKVREYLLGDDFELAAFKGQKLTVRNWNGQLRQPILLADGMITISVSPQEGFLHQHSMLDTLGLDRPETSCEAFKGERE